MRKLNRSVSPPSCLANYKHGRDNWDQVKKADKDEIWLKLVDMQGAFCAYCERTLIPSYKEIEHFKKKNIFTPLTFEWTNLFGSCKENNTCGGFKDKSSLQRTDFSNLIKPDQENPRKYLTFQTNGKVIAKKGLDSNDMHKAELTIKSFNLNSQALINSRSSIYKGLYHEIVALYELVDSFGKEECSQIIQDEMAKHRSLPFQEAREQYFLSGL